MGVVCLGSALDFTPYFVSHTLSIWDATRVFEQCLLGVYLGCRANSTQPSLGERYREPKPDRGNDAECCTNMVGGTSAKLSLMKA